MRPAVFVSYSRHDAVDRDGLLGVLKPLCRKYHDKPLVWVDREALRGGDRWEDKIHEGLRAADVFIVLMSQHFLNSDFCMKEELPVILERQAADGALVLGIALGPVDPSDFVCTVGQGRRLSLQALDCLPKSSTGWQPVPKRTRRPPCRTRRAGRRGPPRPKRPPSSATARTRSTRAGRTWAAGRAGPC